MLNNAAIAAPTHINLDGGYRSASAKTTDNKAPTKNPKLTPSVRSDPSVSVMLYTRFNCGNTAPALNQVHMPNTVQKIKSNKAAVEL